MKAKTIFTSVVLTAVVVPQWLETFREFPPRRKAASFTVDQIFERLMPKS